MMVRRRDDALAKPSLSPERYLRFPAGYNLELAVSSPAVRPSNSE